MPELLIPHQGVAEAFDQPYAVDLSDESEHGDYDSLVQLPDGSYLTVMFNNQGNDEYQVEFWRGPSQGVTGEGDAQRIFATVLNTIQKFIKEHNPWRLTFSATKDVEPGQNSESRAKLYNRLVDRYAAAWGYDALINDLGDQVEYELTRLKPSVAEGLTEIENLPAGNFDGKRMLRLRIPAKRNLQPLLGGTDLLYAVDQAPGGDPRVVIVEPGVRAITKPQIVAVLQLEPVNYLPNTVQVGFITVDEDYRGRGLAKALYGIVFTKMRKNLLSGDTQTPGGKRNWISLVNMPGVQVKGLVQISNDIFDFNKNQVSSNYQKYIDQTIDQIMELGGQFFHKNKDFSFWLFDVVPGKGQLQPYVQNSLSKLYGYDARNLLLATWNRGTNESQQGVAENFADGRKFVEPNFDFEWEEAERYPEFVKLGKDAWIELARKGKAVTINSAQGINNTDAADPDSFKSLVPAKQKRALAQLEKGTVEMPIVAVYSDGHKELIGGNTRLTAMMARDGQATVWAFQVPGKQGVAENFADGKKPGRKGLAKRSGVNTKASVSSLRKTAKNSSGEKQRMAHWLANMKAGRAKKK
jgi:GNAT superfamily N-acetyltransferase